MIEKTHILIAGVTASGKGRLAFDMAKQLDGEILSVDSMKVYRRMDIGTAKPSPHRREQVRYHLIDVVEPSESFSVGRYVAFADEAIKDIRQRNKPVIGVGGTALYIKALLYGLFEGPGKDAHIRMRLRRVANMKGLQYLHEKLGEKDPEAAQRIHPNDAKRIIRALEVYELTGKPISSFQQQFESQAARHPWTIIGLRREKEVESRRINLRAKMMFEKGLVEEVKALLAEDKPLSPQARAAIGYAEVIDYLNGQYDLDQTVELVKKNTRRLAKNQRTWFKTFGNIRWLDLGEDESPEQIFERSMQIIHEES